MCYILCQALGCNDERIHKNVSKLHGEKMACKQTIITEEKMTLLEACTEEVGEREHLGKCQEKVVLWWSLSGDRLGERRCKHT